MAEPGDIIYVDTLVDGEIVTIKKKFYRLIIDFNAISINGINVKYEGINYPPYHDEGVINYFKQPSWIVKIYPDSDVDLRGAATINNDARTMLRYIEDYTNFVIKTDTRWLITQNHYEFKYYGAFYPSRILESQVGGYINPTYTYVYGTGTFEFWANYSKVEDKKKNNDPVSNAPDVLNNDYTIKDATDKILELQQWSDNFLLPPIFGPTNCVYFPSNLGDSNPKFGSGDENPVIKYYPIQYSLKTNEYYNIQGKLNETYVLNLKFPIITEDSRFEMPDDNYDIISSPYFLQSSDYVAPEYKKTNKKPYEFKTGLIVKLRFIEQEKEDNINLLGELKYNDYLFNAIITDVVLPRDNELNTKGTITVKLNQDYGLTNEQFFKAKIVLQSQQPNNFIQNETYSIKRYYKKDLGFGPRLGASVLQAYSNITDKPETQSENVNGIYLYYCVLKDEERLNKPYEGVEYSSYFFYKTESNLNNYFVSHTFTDEDKFGTFEYISPTNIGILEPKGKQYHQDYRNYLIKNLDEHTYEYYQDMKKSTWIDILSKTGSLGYPYSIHTFNQANDNANLTFE